MINVPESFALERARAGGADGVRWVAELPKLVERLVERWDLELMQSEPLHGSHALVALCYRGSEPCALKVNWDKKASATEARALAAWNGNGAVRLLEASPDDGAVLLERLDQSRTLKSIDLPEAAAVIGQLIRKLAIDAPGDFAYSEPWADLGPHLLRQQEGLGNPLPQAWVDMASRVHAGELIRPREVRRCFTRTFIRATFYRAGESSG